MPRNALHPFPSLGKTLLGASFLSLQPLALNVLSIPVMAYIIRRLGPEGYALWMVAASLLAVGGALTNLGLRGAFVRRVAADPGAAPHALAEQLGLRLLLSCIAGAMVFGACVALGYPSPILWCTGVGAAGLLLTTFASALLDLLQAHHRIATIATVNLVAGLALTACSLVAAWRGVGPVGMASAYLTGPAVSAAVLAWVVVRNVCAISVRWDRSRFGRLLVESRFFAVQQILSAGSSQAEALVLPRLIPMGQFGLFTGGTLLASRLTALPDGLCTAAYPTLVRACSQGPERSARVLWVYGAIAVGGGVLVSIVGALAAAPIGLILFPGDAGAFASIVRVTIWSLPLVSLEMVMGYALNAAGKDGPQARVSVPAAAVSLLGAVVLMRGFGLAGACWSMLLRPAVRVAFLVPVLVRTFRPRVGAREQNDVLRLGPAANSLRKAG
jgi:O-antigen/teichoic acid export membrane protein